MKYIANIVTRGKKKWEPFFNVVSDYSKIEKGLPTFIIGKTLMRETFPNANVLDFNIKDNIYWTYAFNENYDRNKRDTERFYNEVLFKLIKKETNYRFFSFISNTQEDCHEFCKKLRDEDDFDNNILVYRGNMAYIYLISKGETIGLSFNEIEYIGKEKQNIKLFLEKYCKMYPKMDLDSDYLKKISYESAYMLPYLYYLKYSE